MVDFLHYWQELLRPSPTTLSAIFIRIYQGWLLHFLMSLDLGVLSFFFFVSRLVFFVLFQRERHTNTSTGSFKQKHQREIVAKDGFDYKNHEPLKRAGFHWEIPSGQGLASYHASLIK